MVGEAVLRGSLKRLDKGASLSALRSEMAKTTHELNTPPCCTPVVARHAGEKAMPSHAHSAVIKEEIVFEMAHNILRLLFLQYIIRTVAKLLFLGFPHIQNTSSCIKYCI